MTLILPLCQGGCRARQHDRGSARQIKRLEQATYRPSGRYGAYLFPFQRGMLSRRRNKGLVLPIKRLDQATYRSVSEICRLLNALNKRHIDRQGDMALILPLCQGGCRARQHDRGLARQIKRLEQAACRSVSKT